MNAFLLSHSRFWIAVGLIGLLLPGLALAQAERDTTRRPPALQEGGWGLQYQVTSLNALLSGFQGSLISARYHLSDQRALRFGVTISTTFDNREESESVHNDVIDEAISEQTSDLGSHLYGLSGQYLHYVEPASQVFVFAGGGPQFSYNRTSRETTNLPDPDNEDFREETDTKETTYSVGLGAVLGVEWFVHSNVSLSVEYPLSLDYRHTHTEDTQRSIEEGTVEEEQTSTADISGLNLGGQSVRIGVTFSFGP
jgi:opacity protein-like surface antigen